MDLAGYGSHPMIGVWWKEEYRVREFVMVKQVLKDAYERRRTNSKPYKEKDVVLEVILCRCPIRTINVQPRKPVIHTLQVQ